MHSITLHYMSHQITFRLPAKLARALKRRARARGVPASQLVREALSRYLAEEREPLEGEGAWRRVAPLVGAVEIDRAALEADELGRRIREHNWRE
ncbi:MAG: hypothetical protein KatS3mg081_0869 [Gemmatimonadales bacterium]|nr:MAG: hypothetical protein KatS3mg081_0869 [Gemmatimonadales bacterium]